MLAKAPVHAPPPPPRAASGSRDVAGVASASTASGSRDGAGVASATGAGSVAASGAGVASVTGAGFAPKKPPPPLADEIRFLLDRPPAPWRIPLPPALSAGEIAWPKVRAPRHEEEDAWLSVLVRWVRMMQVYLSLHYSRGRTQALQKIIIERAALADAQRQSPQEPSQRQRQTQAYRLRGQRQPQAASSLRDPRLDDY